MRVLSASVTARGRAMAERLPYPHTHGSLATTVRDAWESYDAFVLFAATGVVVRVIGPLLSDKRHDPVVVCVDDRGRFAVALAGGHTGANDLARSVAALLGAEPVVTTATDAAGITPLDGLAGCRAVGAVATVTRALLDGEPVWVDNRVAWPVDLPVKAGSDRAAEEHGPGIVVTDQAVAPDPGVVVLHPPTLVLGVGSSTGAPPDDLLALVADAMWSWSPHSVCAIATLDRKADEPAITALAAAYGLPLTTFPSARLRSIDVPNPSDVVADAVGTPSVAEAAALAAAGPGGTLVVEKRASRTATVAVARVAARRGHLAVVGLGPGGAAHRTPAATAAIAAADVVIGYGPYIDLAADAIAPPATVIRSPIGAETERTDRALELAAAGQQVALVCSGDAGVYALATLVFERAPEIAPVDIDVVPGVTAALAAAAALGAPLGHDHVAISLSDLLTPWEVIERRIRAAAEGDFVVSFYNPRSRGREWQLESALHILASHRPRSTPVGIVIDAGRPGQQVIVTTLDGCDVSGVGMTTCVIVGSSTTTMRAGHMMTPRGYKQ